VVAETTAEAKRLALPQQQMMVALRTGAPLRPQPLVEEAEKDPVPDAHRGLLEAMAQRWVIGDPDTAASRIRELAETFDVDEVMIHPVAGSWVGTASDTSPTREATLALLAGQLLG
jgi:alkanesulfonate monooxygenase SsuD/methylene tetrahydromethanopterin reductase-like flavin-dependent oxidoreductase (luciferase family)